MGKVTRINDGAGSRSLFRRLAPFLLLLVITLPALLMRLDTYPPIWFDEGYKTNAARTLAERGVYGTYTTAGYLAFDPGISSGPADIVPIALSFKLFGTGVAEARMVSVLYTLLALLGLYAISIDIYGRTPALFIILVLLATPAIHGISFLLIGRQTLSEAPSLALIVVGLWLWFHSWDNGKWLPVLLAGLALGLGLLSKTQVGIGLLPTLVLIAIGRGLRDRSQLVRLLTPTVIMLGAAGGWTLLGRLATAEQARQENALMLVDAVRTNLLTGLLGRNLSTSALVIIAITSLGGLASLWRLRSQVLRATSAGWAEATIALFVLCSTVWFAFLSIGWPRYAYAALVAGLLLVGKLSWDIFTWTRRWISRGWPVFGSRAYAIAIVGLAIIAVLTNSYNVFSFKQDYMAQQAADYIRTEIPRDAVIESWAWELDALSSHWEFHHPHQRYLFLAIRQLHHEHEPFGLNYDVLQADPDYLVTGPFSDWTRIYDMEIVRTAFVELAEIGVYRIYQRIR